ncbi:type I-B CRISPR-associated endonuclease Cas1b [Desulfothermus naphthae]
MRETLYIFSSGHLKRRDNTLFFETKDGKKKFLPVENIKEIFIFGEVSFNTKLLNFLTQKEIILHYFNYYGYYSGSFYPREHYNSGFMILNQVRSYDDSNKRLYLAKRFVEGAIKNSLKILKYYKRREYDLDLEINMLEEVLVNVEKCISIEELMSFEGKAKGIYYNSFNKILDNKDFCFNKRTRRPPQDYLNTLISFVNSLIYTYVLSEIYQTHLDPRIGFLHTTNFRRFSLNLDIAEIFKVVIGDRLLISLIKHGIITRKDFDKGLEKIILSDKGRRKILEKMEEFLSRTITYRKINKKVSYRRLIRLELYKLEKYLIGDEDYKPFVMEW